MKECQIMKKFNFKKLNIKYLINTKIKKIIIEQINEHRVQKQYEES
jgi:hypothetical protein